MACLPNVVQLSGICYCVLVSADEIHNRRVAVLYTEARIDFYERLAPHYAEVRTDCHVNESRPRGDVFEMQTHAGTVNRISRPMIRCRVKITAHCGRRSSTIVLNLSLLAYYRSSSTLRTNKYQRVHSLIYTLFRIKCSERRIGKKHRKREKNTQKYYINTHHTQRDLVNNTNLHRISHRFLLIAQYWSNYRF